jgi:CheY-like chemotaxis protein
MTASRQEPISREIFAALEQLSRSSAHEVSNTLTAVLGYLDLVQGQLDETHSSHDSIEKAIRAARAAAATVQKFQAEARHLREQAGLPDPPRPLAPPDTAAIQDFEEEVDSEDLSGEAGEGATAGAVVLVAVDDAFVRSILLSGLKAAGHETIHGVEYEEILQRCQELRSRQPVLVVDSGLRSLGGLENLRRVRTDFPEVPIILLLGVGAMWREELVEKLGIVVVRKPFPISELLRSIATCRSQQEEL